MPGYTGTLGSTDGLLVAVRPWGSAAAFAYLSRMSARIMPKNKMAAPAVPKASDAVTSRETARIRNPRPQKIAPTAIAVESVRPPRPVAMRLALGVNRPVTRLRDPCQRATSAPAARTLETRMLKIWSPDMVRMVRKRSVLEPFCGLSTLDSGFQTAAYESLSCSLEITRTGVGSGCRCGQHTAARCRAIDADASARGASRLAG